MDSIYNAMHPSPHQRVSRSSSISTVTQAQETCLLAAVDHELLLLSTFSHSLSVLPYPELSAPKLGRFLTSLFSDGGWRAVETDALARFSRWKVSVSVSLSLVSMVPGGLIAPTDFNLSSGSPGSSASGLCSFSLAAICVCFSSFANQLIDHHNAPDRKDRMKK